MNINFWCVRAEAVWKQKFKNRRKNKNSHSSADEKVCLIQAVEGRLVLWDLSHRKCWR